MPPILSPRSGNKRIVVIYALRMVGRFHQFSAQYGSHHSVAGERELGQQLGIETSRIEQPCLLHRCLEAIEPMLWSKPNGQRNRPPRIYPACGRRSGADGQLWRCGGAVRDRNRNYPPARARLLRRLEIPWGATHVFGVVGDGINSLIEAPHRWQDRIRYVGVRHEEAAAFMASGYAKHTGRLGGCIGTTGPGAIHLLNGIYEACFDGAPVVALTGTTFHDLVGVRYQQDVDTVRLMQKVALYNVEVTGPEHTIIVGNRACRAALGRCDLAPIDFVAFTPACGADGFRCGRSASGDTGGVGITETGAR